MVKQKLNYQQQGLVAFKARRNTNLSSGSNADVQFICNAEYYDFGNNYDTSTGIFTAPVSGVYIFEARAFTETATTARAFFTPSGTSTSGNAPGGIARSSERSWDAIAGSGGALNRAIGSWRTYMNAGETFRLNLWTSAVNQLNHSDTWFAGELYAEV